MKSKLQPLPRKANTAENTSQVIVQKGETKSSSSLEDNRQPQSGSAGIGDSVNS